MSDAEPEPEATTWSADAAANAMAEEPSETPVDAPSQSWDLMNALQNTTPNPPIETVGDLRDLRENWPAYGLRGLEKLAGVDDTWAIVDLMKGVIGVSLEITSDSDGSNAEESKQQEEAEQERLEQLDETDIPQELKDL